METSQKGLESEKEEKGARRWRKEKGVDETARKVTEALKEGRPEPTESATVESVRSKIIPPPVTQRSSLDDRNNDGERVHPVIGSNSRFNVDGPYPPSASSAEVHQDPGRSGPGEAKSSMLPPYCDKLLGY